MTGKEECDAASQYQPARDIPKRRKPDVVLRPFNGVEHSAMIPLVWTNDKVYGGLELGEDLTGWGGQTSIVFSSICGD